jgi:signal transduction histidine kinase
MTGTHYVVPLVASGEKIGTLHLGSLQSVRLFSTPDRSFADPAATFDRIDSAFLSALGAYVAVALESTRLFAAAEQGTARLKALIERIPDGVVLFNSRGEILLFNDAAEQIADMEWRNLNSDSRPYRIRDLEGRPLPRGEWPFFQAVRHGTSIVQRELVFDFGETRKHIEVSVMPIPSAEGQIPSYVGTLKDVTERSEQDRRKDEFLSVASHELRSPMTPLTGFIQMTRRQIERGEMPDIQLIARAEYQVQRLSRLIDGLLDMTRIETGRMVLQRERVDLAELIYRTLDAWSSHPKEFDLQIDIPRNQIVMASVDPVRIDQVLTNIVDNAVKHVSAGGRVKVSLEARPGAAVISVEDNGEGIPKEAVERIFERFYQAEGEPPTGVGLGLYITREIVMQHGGDIAIDSVPGERTTVEISLPLDPH